MMGYGGLQCAHAVSQNATVPHNNRPVVNVLWWDQLQEPAFLQPGAAMALSFVAAEEEQEKQQDIPKNEGC